MVQRDPFAWHAGYSGCTVRPVIRVHVAAWIVCLLLGRPDVAPELLRICGRESRCQPVGVHEGDAHLSRRGYYGQVALGHLDPSCQPYVPRGWATRGPWGLSAASHWEFLPRCYQPQVLDLPIVSAWVAARRWLEWCDRPGRKRGWCG
jgi:hypothetical protein